MQQNIPPQRKYALLFFLAFSIGFAQAQNVGIGTTTPGAKFSVVGTSNWGTASFAGSQYTSHFNVPSSGLEHTYIRGGNALANVIINDIPGSGNVGIGTGNPYSKLEVSGNVSARSNAMGISTGIGFNGGILSLTNSNDNGYTMTFDGSRIQGNTYTFSGTAYKQVVINPYGGNVGIGTNFDPEYKLHLWSTGDQLLKIDGTNSLVLFNDRESNAQYGYLRAWTKNPFNPVGYYGLEIGVPPSAAGDPLKRLLFSTNFNIRMVVMENGNVGIGTTNPTQKLSVNGVIRSKEVIVETGWADYVFDDDYALKPLSEVEEFIAANKHLPNIPSAREIEGNGLRVGEVQKKMMEKIEELTLYIIELKKQLDIVKQKQQ